MQDDTTELELRDRLDLIENMIAEGRRKCESWGWTFVLWGVAYYIAIAWSTWGQSAVVLGRGAYAWPVTMIAGVVATIIIGSSKSKGQPETTMGRAIASIWIAVGISMLLVFPTLSVSGRIDEHSFVAIVSAMLGVANGASGMILKWKMQLACAGVWWITSVAACFGTETELTAVFLVALFLCQIVFGIYAMIIESRRQRGAVHA